MIVPLLRRTRHSACGATQRSREAEFGTGSGAALQFNTALLVHALRLDEAADGQVTEQRRTLEGATVDARVSQLLRGNRLGRSVVEHDDRAGIVKGTLGTDPAGHWGDTGDRPRGPGRYVREMSSSPSFYESLVRP